MKSFEILSNNQCFPNSRYKNHSPQYNRYHSLMAENSSKYVLLKQRFVYICKIYYYRAIPHNSFRVYYTHFSYLNNA